MGDSHAERRQRMGHKKKYIKEVVHPDVGNAISNTPGSLPQLKGGQIKKCELFIAET